MISAEYPPFSIASRALAMQVASVSASLRHGITIEINAGWRSLRPDLLRPSPDTPPSRRHPAWPRRGVGPRRGHLSPPRKQSDPDGSPLKNWYLPCGLFLFSRTFPSGPLPRLGTAVVERKPRKSVRRQATIRSLTFYA